MDNPRPTKIRRIATSPLLTIFDLPNECLLHIVHNLWAPDIITCGRTCTIFAGVVISFWKRCYAVFYRGVGTGGGSLWENYWFAMRGRHPFKSSWIDDPDPEPAAWVGFENWGFPGIPGLNDFSIRIATEVTRVQAWVQGFNESLTRTESEDKTDLWGHSLEKSLQDLDRWTLKRLGCTPKVISLIKAGDYEDACLGGYNCGQSCAETPLFGLNQTIVKAWLKNKLNDDKSKQVST